MLHRKRRRAAALFAAGRGVSFSAMACLVRRRVLIFDRRAAMLEVVPTIAKEDATSASNRPVNRRFRAIAVR